MCAKEVIIIIAEDDDGHAELVQQGLKDSGVNNKIIRFINGEETWNYFNSVKDKIKSDENCYLLLLDINMPVMDGVELLSLMKKDEILKLIPIIMLTTTDDSKEVEKCYEKGCNVYITKPIDFANFAEVLKRIGLFIQVVRI